MENLNTNYNFIEDFIPIEYNKTPKQNIHTFWSHNSTTITKTYDIYKCSNCGAQGHQYRNCIKPIFSYGILYYKTESEFSILMVQRKQTISFVDFVRGKYNLKNINNINRMFSTMTKEEKDTIEYLYNNNLVMFDVSLYFNNSPMAYSNYTYPNDIVENMLLCNIMNDLSYSQLEDLNHMFIEQIYYNKRIDYMGYNGNEYQLDNSTQFGRIKYFMMDIKKNE